MRFASGGVAVDRSQPLSFSFNGRGMQAFAGDTLASALIANDVQLVGRSYKFHRPRGILAAWGEEPNALVRLQTSAGLEPNQRATMIEVCDGLVAHAQNCWPSLEFDVFAGLDALNGLLPAGFYYKTFMWPNWSMFEPAIRWMAGAADAPAKACVDAAVHRNVHCDVLVVGAGPTGLAAALAAGRAGADVVLFEDRPRLGGSLLWRDALIDGQRGADFALSAGEELGALANVTILTRTQVSGAYDHGFFAALERVSEHEPVSARAGKPRWRLWRIRAARAILATGAIERPIVFPGNDRPGVMLASAALEYACLYGAAAARRPILVCNNDDGYRTAGMLIERGIAIQGIVDSRASPSGENVEKCRERTEVLAGAVVTATLGAPIRGVEISSLCGGVRRRLACDGVLSAGGWTPSLHLHAHTGGRTRYDETIASFVPESHDAVRRVVGGAEGRFGLAECLTRGWSAGVEAARETVGRAPDRSAPTTEGGDCALNIQALARTPSRLARGRQWIDLQNDVTDKDIALAAREGFASVELLKRYTTTGMATDQGRTSNVNALTLLGEETARLPHELGVTTFRPPFAPVPLAAFAGIYRGALQRPFRFLPLHDAHEEAGAKFLEASTWVRPDYYPRAGEDREQAVARERRAVRSDVGVFDATPLGKILVAGPDAAKFLDHIYVNAMSSLAPGRCRYGMMASEAGFVLDDGLVFRLSELEFLLSPSSGMVGRVYANLSEWLQCEWVDWRVAIANVTSQWTTLALSGPRSRGVASALCPEIDFSTASFPHMAFREGDFDGAPVRVSRVSFTGELQYEISVPCSRARALWEAVRLHTAHLVGAEAWLRLRIEKGYLHPGTDTDGATTPDDVGFGVWAKRKVDFVGRRSMMRPAMTGPDRLQLVGLRGRDPTLLLPVGAQVMARGAPSVARTEGRITSACLSEPLGASIALALVRNGRARMAEHVEILAGERRLSAQIVERCFLDPENEMLNV